MRDAGVADPGECCVELYIADEERIMLRAEVHRVGKIEGDPVAGTDRHEVTPLRPGFQIQDISKELGRGPFVFRWDNCVIQLDTLALHSP